MKEIILASKSPRRKEIFAKLNLPFKVVESNFEEDMTLKMNPRDLAKFLSQEKAKEVAERFKDHIIIGADTFVALNGELLGKPRTKKVAERMLKKTSGKEVEVISGVTIIDSKKGKSVSKAVVSKIKFREISDQEITNYVATGIPLDKAGGIAVQEIGAIFVEKIEGDYFNNMGLPLFETAQILKEFEIYPL